MYLSENKIDLFSAYKMAEYTYEVLVEYGAQAIEDIRHKRLTKAVEDITFINIAVTGADREHHEKLHSQHLVI